MEVTFVTTNRGKVESLRRRLPEGFNLQIYDKLELPELQGDDSREIVHQKALEAFNTLQRPVLVSDSSFHIETLNGFPGAYIKYALKTLKIEGLMEIMANKAERGCYFLDSLGYCEDGKDVKLFSSYNRGTLSHTLFSGNRERAWSELWKVFIPAGATKTLAELTEQELEELKKSRPEREDSISCFTQFSHYILNK